MPVLPRTGRQVDLDVARGFAIFLVVVGHIVTRGDQLSGNDWFIVVMKKIYEFHMPFFMVLSGITFALSLPKFGAWREVFAYSFKRIWPLLAVWVVFGLVVLAGKQMAMSFLSGNHPSDDFLLNAALLFLNPTESAVRFLWFIYVLAIFLLLVPVLFYRFGRRPGALLLVSVGLCFFNWPVDFALAAAVDYLPFFTLGMILSMHRPVWMPMPRGLFWISLITFTVLLIGSSYFQVPKWLVGSASVFPLLGLAQRIREKGSVFWSYLGQRSLAIYLFNLPVIGLVKGLMLFVLPWNGMVFFAYLPLLIMMGAGLPLAIKAAGQKWLPQVAKFI